MSKTHRFTSRLTDNSDQAFRRDELVRRICHAVDGMTLPELEAVAYDLFTKGYLSEP